MKPPIYLDTWIDDGIVVVEEPSWIDRLAEFWQKILEKFHNNCPDPKPQLAGGPV